MDYKTITELMSKDGFHLIYLSRPECGVCSAIKEKLQKLLQRYPRIQSYSVDLNKVPEAAGQLSVFTIPAVLLYAGGQELVREARYMSMEDLERKISRPYALAFA